MKTIIKAVPTNIITGFLGTGKTSAIQNLLTQKPDDERWAILVNEFGTIGIDGTLYQSKNDDQGGVFVREVPGGCMCCVSGLPMQIALNVLLKLSNPHRLLIEPSGLGHPQEVLALLKSKYYKEVLDIQKVVTLIDPKQFLQSRYFNHETYQQQMAIADTWVINKTDLCSPSEIQQVKNKIQSCDDEIKEYHYTAFGKITCQDLLGQTSGQVPEDVLIRSADQPLSEALPEENVIPKSSGFIKSMRSGEGYHASSWRYHKDFVFSKNKLLNWIKSIDAERVKGVFNTDLGIVGFNVQRTLVELSDFKDCKESRMEIISQKPDPNWDSAIRDCVIDKKHSAEINQFSVFKPV